MEKNDTVFVLLTSGFGKMGGSGATLFAAGGEVKQGGSDLQQQYLGKLLFSQERLGGTLPL